ncbi:Xaa-Pro dipeptidase, partial [Virgibacillus halodenitrificans]|nr:Xaa-Pro dipeptidase [Virgibacillus halodenitrificans]
MDKLKNLKKALEGNNLDGILITSDFNRRYITGFTGTAGVALVGQNDTKFITDFRYMEQANEQAKGFDVIEHKQPIELEIKDQLSNMGIKRLGFEKDHVTYSQFETYKITFDVELIPMSGLVEDLRLIKTEEEVQIIKQAAKIADDAFEHIQAFIKPGVKEIDISNELEFYMRKQG